MKKSTVVAALCLMSASATGSLAVAQQASTEQILAYLDKDGDGKVGLQDYLQEQLPKLAEFDADGDGMLSKKEFTESLQGNAKKNAERSFKGFDTEGARNRAQALQRACEVAEVIVCEALTCRVHMRVGPARCRAFTCRHVCP